MAPTAADLLASAREALDGGDVDGAWAAVEAARAAGDGGDADAERLAGDLCQLDGRYLEAGEAYAAAFRGLRDAGRGRDAARVAIELARLHGADLGRPATGRGWVERARALLAGEGPCAIVVGPRPLSPRERKKAPRALVSECNRHRDA